MEYQVFLSVRAYSQDTVEKLAITFQLRGVLRGFHVEGRLRLSFFP